MTSTLRVNAANTARTKPTTGDTKMSFVNTDHLGWLLCDGSHLVETQASPHPSTDKITKNNDIVLFILG